MRSKDDSSEESSHSILEQNPVLRRLIDTDPNLIFVKDIEGRFVLVNQAVAELYGSTIDGLIGKRDSDFNRHEQEVEHFLQDDYEVITKQIEKRIVEEQVTDSKGVIRWFSTVKRPLQFTPGGEIHVLGVSTDVTEVRKLQGQLAQAQKMQALGQLAGGIAHDFNNLLTAILGHAEVLQVIRSKDAEVMQSVDLIYSAGSRAQQLTGQLLGFARQGKNQHTMVSLKEIIEETITLLRRTVDPSIVFLTNYASDNLSVLGDPNQIQQIIINLVLNARDAILIKAENNGAGNILFETELRDNHIYLTISDDGCGMNDEIQTRMFEPFFTTKEQGQGTGLGLAMVYGIVQNHNGEISVHSVSGKGSRFSISFPNPGLDGYPAVLQPKHEKPVETKGRVLVVDDNPDVQMAAEIMLRSLGYKVTICSSGEAALRHLQSDTDFDSVLVDLMMPGMGGSETVRIIRSRYPQLSVIITTGYGQNHVIQQLVDSGIKFIKKPYELKELRAAIG